MPKKSKGPTPEYDSQRETRVLLEQIRSEVKAVAEQHGSVKDDLATIKSELDTMKMALMENSVNIKVLKQGQDKAKADVDALQSGQKRIEQKLDTALDNHEKRIKNLEAKVGL